MAKKKQEVKLKEPVRIRFKQLANGGKSSVSCPLKPSDSAPLQHSTMPP